MSHGIQSENVQVHLSSWTPPRPTPFNTCALQPAVIPITAYWGPTLPEPGWASNCSWYGTQCNLKIFCLLKAQKPGMWGRIQAWAMVVKFVHFFFLVAILSFLSNLMKTPEERIKCLPVQLPNNEKAKRSATRCVPGSQSSLFLGAESFFFFFFCAVHNHILPPTNHADKSW